MYWTPRDRSPEDGTGPLEERVGPREHFSPGPGPEKKGKKHLCFFGGFRTFGEYHICFLKHLFYFISAEQIIFYSSTEPGTLLWGPVPQSAAHMEPSKFNFFMN